MGTMRCGWPILQVADGRMLQSQTVLVCFGVLFCCQLLSVNWFIYVQFDKPNTNFHLEKYIWKCCLWNGARFVQVPVGEM